MAENIQAIGDKDGRVMGDEHGAWIILKNYYYYYYYIYKMVGQPTRAVAPNINYHHSDAVAQDVGLIEEVRRQ